MEVASSARPGHYPAMPRRLALLALSLVAVFPARSAAQQPALRDLAFMAGCWSGPAELRSGTGTVEERWTPPSTNVMQGMSRTLLDARTVDFEFMLVTADSAGIVLTPYPRGVRSPDPFRLTRLAGDTAVFEAPAHDYPRRIIYRRSAAGLVARIDGGADDREPSEWPMTPAACATGPNVAVMAEAQAPPPVPRGPDRSGRGWVIGNQTMHGIFLGLAVPAMLGADDPEPYGVGLLIGAPLGAILAKTYTDRVPVSAGQSTVITWGGRFGLWQALGWTLVATTDASSETVWGAMAAGLVGGTVAGAAIARHPISHGDAWFAEHASMWGTWYGVTLGVLADLEGDALLASALGGGLAGLAGGALATRRVEWSAGRSWLVHVLGIAGIGAGFGLDLILQPDDDRIVLLVPMVTSAVALAAGVQATRRMDDPSSRRASAGASSALLAMQGRSLRAAIPAPVPTLVPRDDGRTRRFVPGMRLTLFAWTH